MKEMELPLTFRYASHAWNRKTEELERTSLSIDTLKGSPRNAFGVRVGFRVGRMSLLLGAPECLVRIPAEWSSLY